MLKNLNFRGKREKTALYKGHRKVLLVGVSMLLFTFLLPNLVSAINWTNLESYWDFDVSGDGSSNIHDQTGVYNLSTGKTGTITINNTNGVVGNGSYFDGSYCIWGGDILDEDGTNITYTYWTKNTQTSASRILSKYEGGGDGWWIYQGDSTPYEQGHGFPAATTDGGVNDGTWHHIAIILSTAGNNIYVDGELNNSNSNALESDDIARYLSLGCECTTNDCSSKQRYYTGYLDEIGIWKNALSESEIESLYNGGSGLEYGENLSVILISPQSGETIPSNKINFTANYSISSNNNLTNATLWTWDSNGVFNNTETETITGSSNSTKILVEGFTIDDYKWNMYLCYENSTSHICQWGVNSSFQVGSVVNSTEYFSSTYETKNESFKANITSFTETSISNPKLWYNGTLYSASLTELGASYYQIEKTIDVPIKTGDKSFYFRWDTSDITEHSDNYTQTVNQISMGLCNSTLNNPFINFTFKDEKSGDAINATIDASSWDYYIGSGNTYKTFTYSNITNNSEYEFCFSPNSEDITSDYSIQYSSNGYPQRVYEVVEKLTTTVTEHTLYLLQSADGIYVTYQVLNAAEQPIKDVYSVAKRQISGVWTSISSGSTGDDGGVTHWLNPDYTHQTNFSKDGYETKLITHKPTQSTYTVYLDTEETTNLTDTGRGISFLVEPINWTLLNNTDYTFSLNITSDYWSLDSYGFTLKNGGGALIASDSGTSDVGGTASQVVNTGNNKSIVMNYYWAINGNYSNFSRSWTIIDTSKDDWSIKIFFQDLKNYTDEEIFGLNEFSRTFLIFLFIFITVGVMTMVSGVYSPGAIMVEIAVMVTLFDAVLGLIPMPDYVLLNQGFPTLIAWLLAFSVGAWEWFR